MIVPIQMPSNSKCDYSLKVVITGEAGVGKTSIINKGMDKSVNNDYHPTVCFEHSWRNYKINETIIKLQLWDTCGQELYHSIITRFYRSSLLAILVFSLDNIQSFVRLQIWLKELREEGCEDWIIALVGNKKDSHREVDPEVIQEFTRENKINYYIETSALTGENINKLFNDCIVSWYEMFLLPIINNSNKCGEQSESPIIRWSDKPKEFRECQMCWCYNN